MQPPCVVLYEPSRQRWLSFSGPRAVFAISSPSDILPALKEANRLVETRRLWAAGFLSYEAAPAFDPAMRTHTPGDAPLLWLGLFPEPEVITELPPASERISGWQPSQTRTAYRSALLEIKNQIARGNTYQVNYTLRMRAQFNGSPWGLFCSLAGSRQGRYAAYVHTGRFALCSASPELFFELDGDEIRSRPMKGTAPRGLSSEQDEQQAAWLHASEKNRAENLMIVDMVRNDLGRIARTGSVHVPGLFEIERYPTVLQMTSTVAARTAAPIPEIFQALFPCASITGAPKIRTMDIIRNLESTPRGVYTGAAGFWGPGRKARFNVAIRTVFLDTQTGQAEYGTGSGIVWDSGEEDEYEECLLKTRVLSAPAFPPFELLESLFWSPEEGFFLLDRHLDRLCDSAVYFNIPLERAAVPTALETARQAWGSQPKKVRMLVDTGGHIRVEAAGIETPVPALLPAASGSTGRAALAHQPLDPQDLFLYHKTTHRGVYETALAGRPGADAVLLWNPAGEATEFTTANLVVKAEGRYCTPPVACGLLPGTLRAELLARTIVEERTISLTDVKKAEELWAVNSVRGWQRMTLT